MKTLANALSNVARGIIGSGVIIALPFFLSRLLSRDEFNIWGVITQFSNYVLYLDFGTSMAIASLTASAKASEGPPQLTRIICTAYAMTGAVAVIGFVALAAIALQLSHVVPAIPAELLPSATAALLILGGSLLLSLPSFSIAALFQGLERAHIPAFSQGVGRLLGGGLAVAAALLTNQVWVAATGLAVGSLLSAALLFSALRKQLPEIHLRFSGGDQNSLKQILGISLATTSWLVAMMFLTAGSAAIVARYDFAAAGIYASVVALIGLVSGLLNNLFNALIPLSASAGARNDRARLNYLLLRGTKITIMLVTLTALPLAVVGPVILEIWLAQKYSSGADNLVRLLAAIAWIRLMATPLAVLLISTNNHKHSIMGPVSEAAVAIGASLLLAPSLGAMGVAIGLLCGAVVGLVYIICVSLPRVGAFNCRPSEYLLQGMLPGFIRSLPCIIALISIALFCDNSGWRVLLVAVACLGQCVVLWFYGFEEPERSRLVSFGLKFRNKLRGVK